ncbi:MAG: SDR family NAD(P)-dependent oxidoreductase, partial [Bacteroidota bacterium]
MLENKTILITGGAGSLGKTLVGNLLSSDLKVRKVIVYSRDELKHQHMRWEYPGLEEKIDYIIGDIRDQERVAQVCKGVDIIIHAAALKQISACEQNPEECYKTNVVGTQNVIKAAEMDHVEKLLFISTDKAVNPTSIYGNSKQACERLITRADSPQLTCATV